MISIHPMMSDEHFERDIKEEICNTDLTGYISYTVLRALYNLFSWVYIEANVDKAFSIKSTRLEDFLARFNLTRFKGVSISYSTVLFYQRLQKAIDIRALEKDGDIVPFEEGDNKMLTPSDFSETQLYELYKGVKGDISEDMLLFNTLFSKTITKSVNKITSYGQLPMISQVTAFVRPDFVYKLATKQLDVNTDHEEVNTADNRLYILQDSTESMKAFTSKILAIKAFILEEAFTNGYIVEWFYVSDMINNRTTYTKNSIKDNTFELTFRGFKVNMTKVLELPELDNKKVVIITDGTDSFNFSFNTRTRNINVISFKDNINIKNKISMYGRFFKT